MKILLTNDDSFSAIGIKALATALSKDHDVTIAAPQSEMSGVGHSFTIFKPIFLKSSKFKNIPCHAIGGTPSDCVKLAVQNILEEKPDIVISGINCGENSGISGFYSGTVAGAREGAFFGIPSLAISLSVFTEKYYEYAANWVVKFVEKLTDINFDPSKTYLNINFPFCNPLEISGVKVAEQGLSPFDDNYDERKSPNGEKYFWLHGSRTLRGDGNKDEEYIEQNKITITPLSIDMTDREFADNNKELESLI